MTSVAAVPHATGETDQVRYAGFWIRFGAAVVDLAVLAPLMALSVWAMNLGRGPAIAASIADHVVFLSYTVIGHAYWGQTLGKRAVGIRVLDVSGRRIGWPQSVRRSAVDILLAALSITVYCVALAGIPSAELARSPWPELHERYYLGARAWWDRALEYLTLAWVASEVVSVLFNRRRRALHDFIAGTVVVVERRPATARRG